MFRNNIVDFKSLNESEQRLIKEAVEARNFAYCPYSKFKVGAALLTEDGTIYRGCNVENVSFTVGTCAERTAFVKAISEGIMKFTAIAVVADSKDIAAPCGACRQFITEFGNINVYCAKPTLDKSNNVTISGGALKQLEEVKATSTIYSCAF